MAPPMKELPRWLLDNPEFSVAPDWTDIVKQSVSRLERIREKKCECNEVVSLSGKERPGCRGPGVRGQTFEGTSL